MNDATNPNFESLLDEVSHEVIVPKQLPKGTYLCVVGMPLPGKSRDKGTPFVDFPLKPIQQGDDVNDEELSEALGDDSLSDRELHVLFYITKGAIYRLDQFHQDCGIDLETDQSTRAMRNEAVVNREVWAYVDHTPSRKAGDTRVFVNVTRTLPVGD